jgi:hypothetical protein
MMYDDNTHHHLVIISYVSILLYFLVAAQKLSIILNQLCSYDKLMHAERIVATFVNLLYLYD